MNDYLIRGTALEGRARIFAARTTGIVNELARRHETMPTASAALGRTATVALMMGAMLKGEEKLTLQVKGDGPLGQIVVDANAKGEVRGYVLNPDTDIPLKPNGKIDVSGGVGEGFIYVIKDLGLKEPYRGSTPIVSGEIAEDFTYYFAKSEQTPSCVALGVLVDVDYSIKAAGGFILQLLPGLTDEEISEIEAVISQLPPITTLLEQGLTLEQIVERLVKSVTVMERMDVQFKCQCSKPRVEQTLISVGKSDLQEMADDEEEVEVVCHFCNEKYKFTSEELVKLIETL